MKSTIFFLLFSTITTIVIVAQDYNTYDISKYFTPDIQRNKLDLNLSGNANYTDDEFGKSINNTYNGDFQLNLNHFTHTRKHYYEFRGTIASYGYKNNIESDNVTSKHSYFNPKFSLYGGYRLYSRSNVFFSLAGGGSWDNTKDDYIFERIYPETFEESTEKYNTTKASIQLGMGKGRLESVEDARQAVYILENLSKRGVLTRKLTNDEIFTLSQLISSVKNKRFFDSRLHLIDEISTVDSFFVENNLLENSNAPYFTTLYDYWQNGALFERLSGKEFHSFISADFTHRRFDTEYSNLEDVTHYNYTYSNFYWETRYTYEKPVNLYWQNSISASFIAGYYQQHPEISVVGDYEENNIRYYLRGSYSWSYYPNSRTNLSVWTNQQFRYIDMVSFENERSFENSGKFFTSLSTLGGTLNYYISPQFRLSASAGILFDYQKGKIISTDENDNYRKTSVQSNFALIYSIY